MAPSRRVSFRTPWEASAAASSGCRTIAASRMNASICSAFMPAKCASAPDERMSKAAVEAGSLPSGIAMELAATKRSFQDFQIAPGADSASGSRSGIRRDGPRRAGLDAAGFDPSRARPVEFLRAWHLVGPLDGAAAVRGRIREGSRFRLAGFRFHGH